jgi:hypothetical protein
VTSLPTIACLAAPVRATRWVPAVITLLLGAPGLVGVAHAEGESSTSAEGASTATKAPNPAKSTESGDGAAAEEEGRFGHGGQFNLRVSVVAGYRVFFRYPKSPYCTEPDLAKGTDQQKLCGYGAPFAMDVAVGYALIDGLEPFLWGRFGLGKEAKTDTKAEMILGAGVRVYTMADAPIKVYLEPSIGVELEDSAGDPAWKTPPPPLDQPEYKKDVVGRFVVGPQFELTPNVGLYAAGGITLGVLRAIHSTMELEAGLQGRL